MKIKQKQNESALWIFINKHKKIILILLLLIGLLWRFVYFMEMQKTPYSNFLSMNSEYNDYWAKEIAGGRFNQDTVFYRAPLYPFFMGMVYFFTNNNSAVVKILQFLMGLGTCFLIYLITQKLINEKTAFIALALSLFYRMFFYFENELLRVPLILLLNLTGFYFLITTLENKKWYFWFITGIFFGLSAITNSNILIFVLAFMIWLIFKLKFSESWRKTLQHLALILTGLVLPILPITLNNALQGRNFIMIDSETGVNFYIGNNLHADGRAAYIPGVRKNWQDAYEDQISLAKIALNKPEAKSSEISFYWFGKGFQFLSTQPIKAFLLYIKKIHLFWNAEEINNDKSINFITRKSVIFNFISMPYFIIALLSLGGLFFAFWHKKNFTLIYIFILCYFFSVILFYVTSASRMAIMPFLIIFAAYFLAQWPMIKELLKNKNKKTWILGASMTAFCFFIVPFSPNKTNSHNWNTEAIAYQQQGDMKNALKSMFEAIQSDPENIDSYIYINKLYLEVFKAPEKSIGYLNEAIEISPKNILAHYYLALSLKELDLLSEAEKQFQTTILLGRKKIEEPKYLYLTAAAYFELGKLNEKKLSYEMASEYYKQALYLTPDNIEMNFYLGRIYYSLGQTENAKIYLKKIRPSDSSFDEGIALLASLDQENK